ncbi:Arginine-hydroxylase NDUFAF5, mitochondrial [Golovinomyces cichoracearum]|uniref:Arginine-hydroxylase NDUFAF5, mitochondrial n=1 Tax=Golovinomyces cichoracearum TaxID=62708 RepID=A0A420HPW1_9PEZI|nr:Arginine-hydroxylase NDUFAF5, mitochondrial [Golovinomyces cichoracearum]
MIKSTTTLRSSLLLTRRRYATQVPNSAPILSVFDRNVKYLQKERAATRKENSRQVDYLKDEVATRLVERLLDIKRHFPHVLDFGANSCNIAKALTHQNPDNNPKEPLLSTKILHLTAVESSGKLLYRDADLPFNNEINISREIIDEERLPYESNKFDAVLSSMSMHWINDLPSVLGQINKVLKPDAPFLAAMLGGDTIYELRTSLQLADQERRGGVSPHVSPLADVRDMGRLLQRAGFKMLTVDVDDIIIDFPDTFSLMQDLQAMGESNAIINREPGHINRDVLLANEGIYRELYGNKNGTIPATFRIIYMIGWKEGPNQNQPLPRGSGEINMADVLGGGQVV